MTICKVTGSVVSTHKNVHLNGHKIMIVQPVDLNKKPIGPDMLAIDEVHAGEGDLVLVMKEGGGARIILNNKKIPVQAVIVGVIDGYQVEGEK
ncbi:MAG: EutN/CcmL family microcompartment protein [Bacteroidetes bacterium]|nr:EutN/CcmL family microcompartment protein [Bacteroidota bacterium]